MGHALSGDQSRKQWRYQSTLSSTHERSASYLEVLNGKEISEQTFFWLMRGNEGRDGIPDELMQV